MLSNPKAHPWKASTTCLFREPPSCKAIAELLADGKSTALYIIGASDFSEVLSYAAEAAHKDSSLKQNPDRLKIIGIDSSAELIALAKTWHIVITDFERDMQNRFKTALQDDNFGNIFKLQNALPEKVKKVLKQYPKLAGLQRDTVAKIQIGEGMDWYKANQDNLPAIYAQETKMEDFLAKPLSKGVRNHERQIYVLANSWAYMLGKDAADPDLEFDYAPQKVNKFLQVIRDIKQNNKGKDVWIVIGGMEKDALTDPDMPQLPQDLHDLGMKPLSKADLQEAGIKSLDTREWNDLPGKIWKLST